MKQTKTFLITGGTGYIGSSFVKFLLNQGHIVHVVDNFSSVNHHTFNHHNYHLHQISILDRKSLFELPLRYKFDAIFHFAAKLLVAESMAQVLDYYETNVQGTCNILDLMHQNKIKKLIFSSSAAVYDGNQDTVKPLKETAAKKPNNPYGETKLAAEKLIQWACQAYDLQAVALRYFNVAGAYENLIGDNCKSHIIPALNQAIITKKVFKIFGNNYNSNDGTCIRDYIHIADLVNAHYCAYHYLTQYDKSHNNVFNLGGLKSHSVLEIVELAQKLLPDFTTKIISSRPGDPSKLCADIEKAQSFLKWKPIHSLKEIISSDYEWRSKSN